MTKPNSMDKLMARFGWTASEVQHDLLTTDPNGPNEVTDELATSFCDFRTLRTDDIAELKHWLGNPDSGYQSGPLPRGEVASRVMEALHDTDDVGTLIEAARHFVFDCSEDVKHFKSAIEQNLGPFEAKFLSATTVQIKDGKPLVFSGSKPAVLVCDTLIFESQDAQLISYVNLKIQANNVRIG